MRKNTMTAVATPATVIPAICAGVRAGGAAVPAGVAVGDNDELTGAVMGEFVPRDVGGSGKAPRVVVGTSLGSVMLKGSVVILTMKPWIRPRLDG